MDFSFRRGFAASLRVVREDFSQSISSAPEVAADRDRVDPEGLTDLIGGQSLHLRKNERSPLAIRQLVQRLFQQASLIGLLESRLRRGVRIGPLQIRLLERIFPRARGFAAVIVDDVDADAIDPGAKMMSAIASVVDEKEPAAIDEVLDDLVDPAGYFYRYSLPSSYIRRKMS